MVVYPSESKESLCSSSSHETSSQNNVGSDEDTISDVNSDISVVCVHNIFFLGYDGTNLMIYTEKFVNLM